MDEETFIRTVGKAIARQRKEAELTQNQVAEELGVEKESVSRMETGAISPTLARLHQLAGIFGCPVRRFFWTMDGDAETQAATIADMIRSLPEEKREAVVRMVAEMVRVMR